MSLPSLFTSLCSGLQKIQINEILQPNEESEQYGLVLTKKDAKEIIEVRNEVLQSYGRVELETEITRKLIYCFCTSPYISQEDYISTIIDLHEVFYYLKNETEDKIGDDKLIEIIKEYFDHSCAGSLELLIGRELEIFAHTFRNNNQLREWEGDDSL